MLPDLISPQLRSNWAHIWLDSGVARFKLDRWHLFIRGERFKADAIKTAALDIKRWLSLFIKGGYKDASNPAAETFFQAADYNLTDSPRFRF